VPDTLEIAARYRRAVDAGDAEALAALHHPDGRIWHNTDGLEQTVEENAKLSDWVRSRAPDLAFTDVRITPTAEGFLRRHVMTGTGPGGSFAVPSCLIVTLDAAGLITRVEEYIDSAALAPLLARKA
jgi:hypothetical protein